MRATNDNYLLYFIFFLIFLGGCAHSGKQDLLESGESSIVATRAPGGEYEVPKGLARVVFIRARTWDQDFNPMLAAVPPLYVALDDRLTSVMPLGSHVNILIQPGMHTIKLYTVGVHLNLRSYNRRDISFAARPEQVTFIVQGGGVSGGLSQVSELEGIKYLAKSRMAKILHHGYTTHDFEKVIEQKSFISKLRGGGQEASQAILSALPSQDQVASFLGEVAKIAVISMMVIGGVALVAASAGGGDIATPDRVPEQPRLVNVPQIIENTYNTSVSRSRPETGMVNYARGTMEMIRNGENVTIVNQRTGTRYRVDGDRIVGNDGTQYKVIGSQIIPLGSGGSYFISGNSLYANDGTRCDLVGSNFYCQPARR
jgi:hypothetical protein